MVAVVIDPVETVCDHNSLDIPGMFAVVFQRYFRRGVLLADC